MQKYGGCPRHQQRDGPQQHIVDQRPAVKSLQNDRCQQRGQHGDGCLPRAGLAAHGGQQPPQTHGQQRRQRVLPGGGKGRDDQITQRRPQQRRQGHASRRRRGKGHAEGGLLPRDAPHGGKHSAQKGRAARQQAVIVLQGVQQPPGQRKPGKFRRMIHLLHFLWM